MELQAYFYCYQDYFWEVEYENEDKNLNAIFTAYNGASIAYFQEIKDWLLFLKTNGTPPFGVLLMVLFALKKKNNLNLVFYRDYAIKISKNFGTKENINIEELIEKNTRLFNTLSQLSGMISNMEFKQEVLRVLFQHSHKSYSEKKINKMLIQCEDIDDDEIITVFNPKQINSKVFIRDIHILALLHDAFPTPKSIIDLVDDTQKTLNGVEHELEDFTQLQGVDYVESLKSNENLFPIGSLIERLWSGIQIPYKSVSENESPMGGVSDINNKGDYDKLLLTEFANEEIVFLNKAANNELLFLEKEKPPQQNDRKRVFLIDNSIKNWGTVKIINTSIALAISTHPKNKFKSEFYFVNEHLHSIELRNLDKLLKSQTLLNTELSPYKGLNDAMIEFKNSSQIELFLLSNHSTMKEPEMIKFVNENKSFIQYLILSDNHGEINVFKQSSKSRKLIQKMVLDLPQLWKKEMSLLPVLFNRENIENKLLNDKLFYPALKKYDSVFYDQAYFTVQNGNLYKFANNDVGKGLELLKNVVKFNAHLFALFTKDNDEQCLVSFNFFSCNMLIENFTSNNSEVIPFKIRTDFNYKNAHTFNYKKEVYISDGIMFYHLNKINMLQLSEPLNELQNTFVMCHQKMESFVMDYKRNKVSNYSILSELSDVALNYDRLVVNKTFLLFESKYTFVDSLGNLELIKGMNQVGDLIIKNIQYESEGLINELGIEKFNEIQTHTQFSHYALHTLMEAGEANDLKEKLESMGAVCYYKATGLKFEDGSLVNLKNGILTFQSSNKEIPIFYSPLIIGKHTCFCHATEYCGNQYFYNPDAKQDIVDFDYFEKKYIIPFFKHLVS